MPTCEVCEDTNLATGTACLQEICESFFNLVPTTQGAPVLRQDSQSEFVMLVVNRSGARARPLHRGFCGRSRLLNPSMADPSAEPPRGLLRL